MAPDAEVFLVAGLAGFRLLLSLSGMELQPPLRVRLIALMAVRTEEPVMTPITLLRVTSEFRRMLCEPSQLMLGLYTMAILAEAVGMANRAVLL